MIRVLEIEQNGKKNGDANNTRFYGICRFLTIRSGTWSLRRPFLGFLEFVAWEPCLAKVLCAS